MHRFILSESMWHIRLVGLWVIKFYKNLIFIHLLLRPKRTVNPNPRQMVFCNKLLRTWQRTSERKGRKRILMADWTYTLPRSAQVNNRPSHERVVIINGVVCCNPYGDHCWEGAQKPNRHYINGPGGLSLVIAWPDQSSTRIYWQIDKMTNRMHSHADHLQRFFLVPRTVYQLNSSSYVVVHGQLCRRPAITTAQG